jgi:hypothetical protein
MESRIVVAGLEKIERLTFHPVDKPVRSFHQSG